MPAPIASAAPTPPTRVAVVAVHGVADQAPGESAASIADLLVRRGAYSPSEVKRLALRVEDDGVGLGTDFQLDQAKTLGLQLVQTLVIQLRAEVSFRSEPGHTEFDIWFQEPAAKSA